MPQGEAPPDRRDADGRTIPPVDRVDLNLDAGEGVADPHLEDELISLVSSVNVACGFHAGDPYGIRRVVESAHRRGVAVGAHPSLPDRSGFGRRFLRVTPTEVEADVAYQVGALAALCALVGGRLHHVKPHGALYHLAAQDASLARAVAAAVARTAPDALVYAPPASALEREARAAGLAVAREGFTDRGYDRRGRLLPRGHPGALLTPEEAAAQALLLARGRVRVAGGDELALACETLCLHGDTPGAVEVARQVRASLEAAGVRVAPPLPARGCHCDVDRPPGGAPGGWRGGEPRPGLGPGRRSG